LERRGRRDAVIILVLMIMIAAVITSWITGLWSCEAGRKDLTEKEKLSIADYINSISVLTQHSNKVSINFFTTLNKIKETSKPEIESSLSQSEEESLVIYQNCQEMNAPAYFEVSQGYLKLVFDMRNRAYNDFEPALFNILSDLDVENSTSLISQSFLLMNMSDEVYRYFQQELKSSGEKLGINNLTIIDSTILEDKTLLDSNKVSSMIQDYKSVTSLQERRGVALILQAVAFNPQEINKQDDYHIIKNGTQISLTINVENQGNVAESNIPVKATYSIEGVAKPEIKEITIGALNPSEQKPASFTGFKAYPGKKCEIKIEAGPVENEASIANNTVILKIMMEK
jgi:hypothetical protein